MPQLLHLLILDAECRAALGGTVGGRWLLPTLTCRERARAPLVVERWLADRNLEASVVGQWLGRVTAAACSIDWLIAIHLPGPRPAPPPPQSWFALDRLLADPPLLPYQAWAIQRLTKSGDPAVSGPFGSLDWVERVHAWVSAAAGVPVAVFPRCFRASAYEVVLAFRSGVRQVYFKGLAADRASEAHAMCEAARVLPDSFPRTIACETQPDGSVWWLMDECPGTALAACEEAGALVMVASDLARLQRRVADRCISPPRLDIEQVRLEVDRLLGVEPGSTVPRAVSSAFSEVSSMQAGWTPLDLDPLNAFVDDTRVRYIDLDARIAAEPVALSILCRRLRGHAGDTIVQEMQRAYANELGRAIPWPAVSLVSSAIEAVAGWQRTLRNIERGEVAGQTDALASLVAGSLTRAWARERPSRTSVDSV